MIAGRSYDPGLTSLEARAGLVHLQPTTPPWIGRINRNIVPRSTEQRAIPVLTPICRRLVLFYDIITHLYRPRSPGDRGACSLGCRSRISTPRRQGAFLIAECYPLWASAILVLHS